MRASRAGAAVVAAAIGTMLLAPASGAKPDAGDAAPRTLERPARVLKDPKLESRLRPLAEATPATALSRARSAGLDTAAGKVRVMVEGGTAAGAAVTAVGGTVESSVPGLLEALVPAAALDELSRAAGVARVRAPFHAVPLGVESQGVGTTSAAAWHAKAQTGLGAKVAVIDLGFADYAARQAAGELPAGLVTQDFCGGMGATEPHGTAVAEIVHEMAPSAQLHLICIDTEADLKLAADYVKANGITIVNHSVGWFNTSRGDGSGGPLTPDGIVADARANEILWVNAAGNSAQRHWSGTFVDSDGGGFHDWTPTDETNTITLATNQEVCGFLKWDAWPTTTEDYDLVLGSHALLDAGLDWWVAVSANDQATGNLEPTEGLCYLNTGPTQAFFFAIAEFAATATPRFDLFVTSGSMEYRTVDGSVVEPASSPHAFAVGATCWSNDALEPYSSQGPTIDGRVKPDVAAPAAVTSGIYGPFTACGTSGFTGTSAAAPHVAGAAALWRGMFEGAFESQLRSWLESDAFDLGPTLGKDVLTGAGKLLLPTATPDVSTDLPGSSVPAPTSLDVSGSIITQGLVTTYWWEYGPTTSYGFQTGSSLLGAPRGMLTVSGTLGGLTPDTQYHYRLVASNLFGTSYGADRTQTTKPAVPPTVVTRAAREVGVEQAWLDGTVDPRGSSTDVRFEWGTTTAYGNLTPATGIGSIDPTTHAPTISGLLPGVEYHYRITATNAFGTSVGEDMTFTTPPAGAPPSATTGVALATFVPGGTAMAALQGEVIPNGYATQAWFEYSTASGPVSTTPSSSAGFGTSPRPFSAVLSGLTPGTTYSYKLVVENAQGRAAGAVKTFTAPSGPPSLPPPPGGGGGGLQPDLTLSIAHSPATVAVGDTFTYTFAVANKTSGMGTQMNLTFTLPERVELLTALFERGNGCRLVSGTTYTCFLDFMSGFMSTTVRAIVRLREAGELRVNGAVGMKEQDANPADNAASYAFTVHAPFTPPATPTPPKAPAKPKNVTKTGTARPDVLRGGKGNDLLRGLGGNDRLYGGLGNDRLLGGAGRDRLEGHKGRDTLLGGPGNDTIVARDRAVDTIRCGTGRDIVVADRNDEVAKDCEVVRRG